MEAILDKKKIITVIESVLQSIKGGMRELNSEKAFFKHIDPGNFKYIGIHGEILDFPEFKNEVNDHFGSAQKAEYDFLKDDIRILAEDVALVTYLFNGSFYFESTKLSWSNCASSFVFKKSDKGWKMIQFQESIQESTFIESKL